VRTSEERQGGRDGAGLRCVDSTGGGRSVTVNGECGKGRRLTSVIASAPCPAHGVNHPRTDVISSFQIVQNVCWCDCGFTPLTRFYEDRNVSAGLVRIGGEGEQGEDDEGRAVEGTLSCPRIPPTQTSCTPSKDRRAGYAARRERQRRRRQHVRYAARYVDRVQRRQRCHCARCTRARTSYLRATPRLPPRRGGKEAKRREIKVGPTQRMLSTEGYLHDTKRQAQQCGGGVSR
jgi:hypothetical protein